MLYVIYLLCMCHPLCFNLQHGYRQAVHQLRTQQTEKCWAEQQDFGQISATHRHEDARCVPLELLMCKVVITKCGLPACCMECTYSAGVSLFASICSTDIVKLLIRCNFVHATRRKILSRATRLGRDIGDTSSWRCDMCASRAAHVQSGYHKI